MRVPLLLRTILLFGLAWPGACAAHDIHFTGIKMIWAADGLTVSVLTPASRLAMPNSGKTDYDAALRRRLSLRLNGAEFTPGRATLMVDRHNDMVMWQARSDGPVSRIEVLTRLYPEDPASREIVSVFRQGQLVQEAILDASHPSLALGERAPNVSPLTVAGRFTREGVLHVMGGMDHVCFLFGLLLLGGSLRQLLKTITAFTLAHSVTLSLAATGVFAPPPRLVEPLIALSIVAIALENLRVRTAQDRDRKADRRPWIAFGFGLIHGFGFAGALAEVGLPREALGWRWPRSTSAWRSGRAPSCSSSRRCWRSSRAGGTLCIVTPSSSDRAPSPRRAVSGSSSAFSARERHEKKRGQAAWPAPRLRAPTGPPTARC